MAPANASILGILYKDALSTSTQLSSLGFKQEKKGSSTRAKREISIGGKRATILGVRKEYPTEARNTGPAYWTIPTLTPQFRSTPLSLFWRFSTLIIRLKINEICPEVKDNHLGGAMNYLVRKSQIKQFERGTLTKRLTDTTGLKNRCLLSLI